jgi:hypothetical protein
MGMAAGGAYSSGYTIVELDGKVLGSVVGAEGGEPFADVTAGAPSGKRVPKQLGPLQYAPIVLTVGAMTVPALFEWVRDTLDGTGSPKDGALILTDYTGRDRERLEWDNAVIDEVVFPALDGRSSDTVALRVTLTPERARWVPVSGSSSHYVNHTKPKDQFLASRFELSIDTLVAETSRARSISEIVLRRQTATDDAGKVSDVFDIGDVIVTFPEAQRPAFSAWFDDLVTSSATGGGGGTAAHTASIALLTSDLKRVLVTLELDGVGTSRVSRRRDADGSSGVELADVSLYSELAKIVLSVPAAPAPAPPPDVTTAPVGGATPTSVPVTADAPVDDIAQRLYTATVTPAAGDDGARGLDAGRTWAAGYATRDELAGLAKLAELSDWTVIVLRAGHTLLTFLAETGVLTETDADETDLTRDRFTEGLVEGADEVYRNVVDRLAELDAAGSAGSAKGAGDTGAAIPADRSVLSRPGAPSKGSPGAGEDASGAHP